MSSRLAISGYVIAAAAAFTSRAAGQDLAALAKRLDETSAKRARAEAALVESRRSFLKLPALTDTVVIGGGHVTVLSFHDVAPIVRDAALRADTILGRVSSVIPRIHGAIITVIPDTASSKARETDEPMVLLRFSLPPYNGGTLNQARLESDAIERAIEDQTLNRVMDKTRTRFRAWRSGPLPLRPEEVARERDWGAVRFDVLSSRALIGPRCYAGEIPACSMLLGLTPADDPVMSWYDSLARYDNVHENKEWAGRVNRLATDQCLKGDDAACGEALRSIHRLEQPPGGGVTRDALTGVALQLGGDRAVERMISSSGTAAEALAAGAGVPIDSVLRIWQRNLRDRSIGSDDMSLRLALVAITWIAILFFASTRISRWR